MSNPLIHIHHVLDHLIDSIAGAAHCLRDWFKAAWQRHLSFMDDRESYRAQVVAGVAALVAVTELDPRVAALLVAVLGLHAAAFGHRPPSLRTRSSFDDDPRWDPFG